MASFAPVTERRYHSLLEQDTTGGCGEVLSGITDALQEPKKLIGPWLNNLRSLSLSVEEVMDPLSTAETLLILEMLDASANILKPRLLGQAPPASALANAREVAFVYEQFLLIYNRLKPSREALLQKALPKQGDEQEVVPNSSKLHCNAETQDNGKTPPLQLPSAQEEVRMDVQSFIDAAKAAQAAADGGIYRAPKSAAAGLTGLTGSAQAEAAAQKKQREIDRLRRSEMVKALTQDYTDQPEIHDDGFDMLDATSRNTLTQMEAVEEAELDQMRRLQLRKKSDQQKYHDIKTRQKLLTRGAQLSDISAFIDRLGDTPSATTSGHDTRTKGKRSGKGSSKKVAKSGKRKSSRQ